jgi:hypothetical protein
LSDATDHALATIASILDQPETHREAEKPASEARLVPPAEALISPDGENYSKPGPGPIAALRFRWTARRADNGEYFVDETRRKLDAHRFRPHVQGRCHQACR